MLEQPIRGAVLGALVIAPAFGLGGCSTADRDPAAQREGGEKAAITVSESGERPSQKDTSTQSRHAQGPDESAVSSDRVLRQARRLAQQGEAEAAREVAAQLLIRDPENVPALFLAGELEAARGNWNQAVAMFDQIPRDHPQAGIAALGQSADCLLEAERWKEAERRYRMILERNPTARMAHRRLAYLLNRQGRRQEAAEHLMELCRAGDVSETELLALISITAAFSSPDDGPADSLYAPVGALGKARAAYFAGRLSDAAEFLEQAAAERSLTGPEAAFLGRVLAEQQRVADMSAWLEACPSEARNFGNYWAALGNWMLQEGEHEKAVDFFCEAVLRIPSDRFSYNRLSKALRQIGEEEAAQRCRERGELISRTADLAHSIRSSAVPAPELIDQVAGALERLRRPIEAVMWRAVAANYRGNGRQAIAKLNQQRLALVQQPQEPSAEWILCGLDRDAEAAESAIAGLGGAARRSDPSGADSPATETQQSWQPTLVNVASEVGITGRYFNKVEPTYQFTLLHHSIGGGVAVLDFDLDGRPDLYFPQGASEPDRWHGVRPNQMYRNLGERFQWITEQAGADDRGYGQGVTAGDVNADGFPDLLVANIGKNCLLLNNGDGTFRNATSLLEHDSGSWSTSVAIADIDGDQLPDLVESNYIADPAIFTPQPVVDPKTGQPNRRVFPRPIAFRAAVDWLHRNRGDGSLHSTRLELPPEKEPGSALGLLVSDIDARGKNEIFVANDMRANHYWSRKDVTDKFEMVENAVTAGCAYSARGNPNACMGIASADFTRDGLTELAVTNFADEPMNFFVQSSPGRFIDAAAQYNLFEPSYGLTSFGTQALDYDNNGAQDIAVISGHIFNDPSDDVPFRMRPQLFDASGERFQLASVEDDSGYWSTPSLGRALATLDWNRDGRTDLVATHLDLPHALLENQTDSPNHWLQLRLVGTTSERDAIGARIRLAGQGNQWYQTVNTGDGFECKNEAVAAFGLGAVDSVETVEITWPSGRTQRFNDLDVDRRWLIVEDDDQPFELTSNSS